MNAQGAFVVAYTRDTNNINPDVFAKSYNANSQSTAVVTVADSSKAESNPSIAMIPDGRFDIAYQYLNSSTNSDILALRFSAARGVLGIEPVATSSSSEVEPSIAIDNQGDAVVAYAKLVNNDFDIEATRISSTGALSAEINISSNPADDLNPSVAIQPGGSGAFAVAFNRYVIGVEVPEAEVAVVDGSNIETDLYDLGAFYGPMISAQGADGFLLTYASPNLSGLNTSIFGRRGTFD